MTPGQAHSRDFELKVECYSGYRADERPQRFAFLKNAGAPMYEVKDLMDQWYGVDYRCFRVRADDGNIYILRHEERRDCWRLDSFRRA